MLYFPAKNEVKTILVIFHVNESRLTERTLWPKLKKQTVKQLEITQSICCFYICLSIYSKLAL